MASKKDLEQLVRGVGGRVQTEKLSKSKGGGESITCFAPGGMTWDGDNDEITASTTNDAVEKVQEAIDAGGPVEMAKA